MRVPVVGSYGVGLTMRVQRAPEPGETVSAGGGFQVKASGSIKSYDQAASLLRAGAVLLGTSAGKAIVAGAISAEGSY
jgi:deoxyribose-phosphate aldolase